MADSREIEFSEHALDMIVERAIDPEWIYRTFDEPLRVEPDRSDPGLRHALRPIPERGGRVLWVVYNAIRTPPRVVTMYFDRRERGLR